MSALHGKTALITGASSGIGEQFCDLFAADGVNLVITSSPRSALRLEVLADSLRSRHGVGVRTIPLDLAEPLGTVALWRQLDADGVVIDYLVNSAGFGIVGLRMQDYDPESFSRMIAVNVTALAELCMLFADDMVTRGAGAILNVSALSGYVVPHGLETGFAATKAFVISLSEGLANDLRGTGVTCTHLAPGPTRTGFFASAGLEDDSRLRAGYADPAAVARAGYRAMLDGRPASVPGLANKIVRFITRLSLPRTLTARATGYAVER